MVGIDLTHRIQPSNDTLAYWADHLLPDLDVWFWDESDIAPNPASCMVMSRQEYLRHPAFADIRYVNAYLHWQIPPTVTRVIVSGPGWITSIDDHDRQRIISKQVDLQRGLVFPHTWFGEPPGSLRPFTVQGSVVLCHDAWERVPDDVRRVVLLAEQQRWDAVDCLPIPAGAPAHIQAIANTFGQHEGANCLGVTAYCVTAEDWMSHHWMFPIEFHDLITRHGYRPIAQEPPEAGDVVAFEAEARTVHAAFCVREDRFLNKNGQSRFNPVRIVDWSSLSTDWHEASWMTYRQVPDLTS